MGYTIKIFFKWLLILYRLICLHQVHYGMRWRRSIHPLPYTLKNRAFWFSPCLRLNKDMEVGFCILSGIMSKVFKSLPKSSYNYKHMPTSASLVTSGIYPRYLKTKIFIIFPSFVLSRWQRFSVWCWLYKRASPLRVWSTFFMCLEVSRLTQQFSIQTTVLNNVK